MHEKIKEIIIPLTIFILFFIIETFVEPGEIALLLISVAFVFIIFFMKTHEGEIGLFFLGMFLGFFIEYSVSGFSEHQMWEGAKFLNIPLWLPVAWGIGFVIITRLGIEARKI